MPPSMNRRYWRSYLYLVPGGVLLAVLAGALDIDLAWVFLACPLIVLASALHVTRPRASEEEEYREFARERGIPYPPPPRKGLLRR